MLINCLLTSGKRIDQNGDLAREFLRLSKKLLKNLWVEIFRAYPATSRGGRGAPSPSLKAVPIIGCAPKGNLAFINRATTPYIRVLLASSPRLDGGDFQRIG
jgi:hypothetical protein